MTCPGCAAELDDAALSCPQCLKLTHSAELEQLAAKARAAWRVGKFAEERAIWTESLKLLPEGTVQHRSIQQRLRELEEQSMVSAGAPHSDWKKVTGMGAGPVILLLLSKGKFLLLGLTKVGTLLTMLASLGVYWSMYGWAFAAGLVVSIYIHEMGHVAAIRRYGFPASAPMFIPGFGAFIQLRGLKVPPIPDARIGLAGPLYGLGAALGACVMYLATQNKIWAVIAHFGAIINLFNLIPIWQLDGSRGFHALTRLERGIVLSAALMLWMFTGTPMLLLVAGGAGYRLFTRDWQAEADRHGLWMFLGLMAALAIVSAMSSGPASLPVGAGR